MRATEPGRGGIRQAEEAQMKRSKLAYTSAIKAPAAPCKKRKSDRHWSSALEASSSSTKLSVANQGVRGVPDLIFSRSIDAPGSLATAQTLLERARIMHSSANILRRAA